MQNEYMQTWRVWSGTKMYYPSDDIMLSLFSGGIGWGLYEKSVGGARLVSGEKSDSALMMWSGLKDKNGKLIYVNDIVKRNDNRYVVFFINGTYTLSPFKRKYDGVELVEVMTQGGALIYYNQDCEVVGNFYENKKDIP